MRRILLSMLLVATSCSSVTLQTTDAEPGADESQDLASVADDSPPTIDDAPERNQAGVLRCTGEMESTISDFVMEEPDVSDDTTAAGEAANFMSATNSQWQLRRDWQRLSLDEELSNDTTFIYSDAEGYPYLVLNMRKASGTWVVGSMESCAPLSEDIVALDEGYVPIPNSAGELPFHQRLECAGNLVSMEFLSWFPAAEGRDFQQMRDAIDPFLESAEGGTWQQDAEWFVAHADEDNRVEPRATLVARDGDNFAWMNLAMTDGEWRWSGSSSGDCELHILLEDQNTVEWQVIDSSPDSSIVRVLANERECVSGQQMGDRLREPYVTLTPEFAYVLLAADPPPGDDQDCPGNPSVEIDIDLGEPLGDREIRNTQTTMGWFSTRWPDK